MQSTNPNARWLVGCIGLGCLAILPLSAGPAAGQKEPKKADALPALLKARLDAAKKGYGEASGALTEVKRPGDGINLQVVRMGEACSVWSVRWLNAQRDMSDKKDEQIAALEAHLKRMKDLQKKLNALAQGGLVPQLDITAAAWYVAEAEVWLEKEKAK
jgi:hypothetical protein